MMIPFLTNLPTSLSGGSKKIIKKPMQNIMQDMLVIALKNEHDKWVYTINIYKQNKVFRFVFHEKDFIGHNHKERINKMMKTIFPKS